jgi:hypothetical protein
MRSYNVGDVVEHAIVGDSGVVQQVKTSWKRQASGNTTQVRKYVVQWNNGPQQEVGVRTIAK